MDKKDIGKKMLKSGGKMAAQAAENNVNNSNDTAGEIAKTGKDVAKGAVSTGKMAAKLAAQDYLGAIKEFFKDPKGVLTTVIAIVLVPLIIIACVMTTLVNSVWNIIADKPVSSMVDEYIDDLNYAEKECFSKACESVSEEALNEISEKVLAIDLGEETLNKTKNENFKNPEAIQQNLGMAYNSMRRYSANGKSYPLYDKILMGEAKVFPIAEDNSNGFTVEYNNAGMSPNTTWQRVTHLIDFNTNEATYQKYIKKTGIKSEDASFDGLQSELDKTNKVVYDFIYNNERINSSGYTFSMLEMIFNEKYDFEAEKEMNQGNDSLGGTFADYFEKIEEARNNKTLTKEMLSSYLSQLGSLYKVQGNKAYYLNSNYVTKFNGYVDEYNNKYVKDADSKSKLTHIADDENYIKKTADGARLDRKKAFKEFIKKEEVYKKLLTKNVTVECTNPNGMYNYRLKIPNTSDKLKSPFINVQNTKKLITVTIDVDICDYDTLAQIFGYKIQDENGKWVDNEELLNWIITNGGLDSEEVKSSNEEKTSESSEESSVEDTSSVTASDVVENIANNTTVDQNSFLWPLDLSDKEITVSSKFGDRDNPFGGGNEKHKGLDISAPMRTKIAASIPGKVVRAGYSSSYGNVVEIESEVNINGERKTVRTLYAHMSGIAVKEGVAITRGENLIGYVGSTGNSTGPHLHFEVKIKNDETGKFENVDPLGVLNEGNLYYLNSSALSNFDGSLNSFFENCKDSGTATAAVLTDAGYTKSSMYWQYKNNVYNVMFRSAVSDSSKQKFFVDTDNIVKNDDGSLKIVEYSSADFEKIDSSFANNVELARDSAMNYNKKYYAVYCYPDTVVQMNMSGYRTNFKYERMSKGQNVKDNFYNNKIAGSIGGINYIVSNLPCDLSNTGSKLANYIASDYEMKSINDKEKAKSIKVSAYNKDDYEPTQQFSYLSYVFANVSYGFEVANLQISFPDGNGGEHLMTASDYNNNNYGVFHLNKDVLNQTVTEKFNDDTSDSDFQMGNCILGNVLNENFYPKNWKNYDENDTSTYPFFIVSVTNTQFGAKSGMNIDPPALEDIFDLDTVGDTAFIDSSSNMTWPIVKSYEHTNDVYPLFNGTVISADKENSQMTIRDSVGSLMIIKNIIPAENIVGAFGTETCLGRVPDGVEVQISGVTVNSDGSIKEETIINASKSLKTVLNISSRSEMSMAEDSEGRYNKVLSMMSGEVVDVTTSTIKVKSVEENLYYEYSGLKVNDDILDTFASNGKVSLASGSEVGILYLTDKNNNTNHLSVIVYTDSANDFDNSVQYYNPANYFKFLKEEETSARKILIQNNAGQTLSGIILNRGCEMQLTAKITPDSARGSEVTWISDNPDLVSVDSTGKIVASSDKYGIATISCSFVDGEGISGSCVVNVPEKLVDISVSCANGFTQPEKGKLSDDKYKPCMLTLLDPDAVLDIEMKNGVAKADFNAYTTQTSALKSVKWSIVDGNGNLNSEFATIDERGSLVSKKAMKENQTIYVKAESADNIGESTYVLVAVRIVQPLKSLKLNPDSLSFVLNNKESETLGYSYTCVPADATYQSVTASLSAGSENYFSLNSSNQTVAATSPGSGYLKIVSNHYPNITSQISLEAGVMVDKVKIVKKPTQLMSGENYELEVKGYYKNKEVSLNSAGVTVEWTINNMNKKSDNVYMSDNIKVNNSTLCIPQILHKEFKTEIKVNVNSMHPVVSDSFTATVYPFVSIEKSAESVFDGKIGMLYSECIRSSDKAQTVNEVLPRNIVNKFDYSPSGLESGKEYKINNYYPSGVKIEFESDEAVSVVYDNSAKTIIATVNDGYIAGTFTATIIFKDGRKFTGEFNVSN